LVLPLAIQRSILPVFFAIPFLGLIHHPVGDFHFIQSNIMLRAVREKPLENDGLNLVIATY